MSEHHPDQPNGPAYEGQIHPETGPQPQRPQRALEPYVGHPGHPATGQVVPHQAPYGAYGAPGFGPAYGVPVRPPVSGALVAVAWIVAILTCMYMLPWAVAVTRNRSNMGVIGLLNFLLGWSFVGWVVSLVMACMSEPAPVVVVNQHSGYYPQR